MKTKLIMSIGLTIACCALAPTTHASTYIFGEWGKAETQPDLYLEEQESDVFNLGFGYNFSNKFSAEVLYSGGFSSDESVNNSLQTSLTSASVTLDKLDVLYLGANYKIGDKYYAKISGGYAYTEMELKVHAQSRRCCFYEETYSKKDSTNSFFTGLGLGVRITDQFSLETNYRTTTDDNRFSTVTIGAGYSF
ncbi:MAG TPA: outer membrane beta-barrel protein [Cellvibrio sp.]|nr:outer membrane beta-barrel protein [Cellvibrio sp.]